VKFRETVTARDVQGLRLPSRSPNLSALTEFRVRSVKEECREVAEEPEAMDRVQRAP
jgi:hypothetical protein